MDIYLYEHDVIGGMNMIEEYYEQPLIATMNNTLTETMNTPYCYYEYFVFFTMNTLISNYEHNFLNV